MENFIIKNANKKFILIEDNDNQFKNASIFFIKGINDEYEKFLEQHKEIAKEYHQKTKDLNIKYFENEFIQTNSPLTILNAKWGQGKTYFIHKFLYNFYENKKNKKQLKNDFYFKHFQDVCLINVWNYATKNNIPFELINNILTILILMNEKSSKIKKLLKAIKKIFLNLEIEASINLRFLKFTAKSSKKNDKENEKEKKLDKLIEELNLNKEELSKTIIILDNIERLNNDSWEIIKCINKLSRIKNLFFILPMNINSLNSNKKAEKEFECPIEKYIFNSIFELKQNYLPILKKLLPKSKINNYLNQMLEIDIEEQKLSLRKLEKRIKTNNLKFSSNDYLFHDFINNIWGELTVYKKYINDNLTKIYDKWIDIEVEINNLFNVFKNFNIYGGDLDYNSFTEEEIWNSSKEIRSILKEHYHEKDKLTLIFDSCEKNKSNINLFNKHLKMFKKHMFNVEKEISKITREIKEIKENQIMKIKKHLKNDEKKIQMIENKNSEDRNEAKKISHEQAIVKNNKKIADLTIKINNLNNLKNEWLGEVDNLTPEVFQNLKKIMKKIKTKISSFYKIEFFYINFLSKHYQNQEISIDKNSFLTKMEDLIIKKHIHI